MRRCSTFVLTLLLPSVIAAQSPPAIEPPNAVMFQFSRFADVYGSRLIAAFDSIPAAKYAYRPTRPQQTIGYIAQHLEAANYSLCERLGTFRRRATAKDSLPDTVKSLWPKDTLVRRLEASLRFCDSIIERLGKLDSPATANTLIGFETDLAEHYSQLSGYMRLLGMLPPSALPERAHTAITLPVSALAPYVGVYEFTAGLEAAVTLRDGALFIQVNTGGPPAQLWPERSNEFFVKDVAAQIAFTRGATGSVSGFVLHQYGRDRPARKLR